MTAPIRRFLRRLIGNTDIYQRARSSWIYDAYWQLADRRIVDDREEEGEFYRTLLVGFREGDLVFDIGANEGYKTGTFLKLGARVVCLEPDETCQELLRQKFCRYRIRQLPVIVVPKAVSDRESVERIWIDTPGSAKNTLSEKWASTLRNDARRFGQKLDFGRWKNVETISIERLIETYGSPFFIKIDVEGYELNVLKGMSKPVPYLSFEVNLPEFRKEGMECVEVLRLLQPSGVFNHTEDCRKGMAIEEWLPAEEYTGVLATCDSSSIEVFWKTVG
jgi:FkbM family methyltransferase